MKSLFTLLVISFSTSSVFCQSVKSKDIQLAGVSLDWGVKTDTLPTRFLVSRGQVVYSITGYEVIQNNGIDSVGYPHSILLKRLQRDKTPLPADIHVWQYETILNKQ